MITIEEWQEELQRASNHLVPVGVVRKDDSLVRAMLTRKEAAHVLAISPRQLDYLISGGHVRIVKLGKRKINIPVQEIKYICKRGLRNYPIRKNQT